MLLTWCETMLLKKGVCSPVTILLMLLSVVVESHLVLVAMVVNLVLLSMVNCVGVYLTMGQQ